MLLARRCSSSPTDRHISSRARTVGYVDVHEVVDEHLGRVIKLHVAVDRGPVHSTAHCRVPELLMYVVVNGAAFVIVVPRKPIVIGPVVTVDESIARCHPVAVKVECAAVA